MQPVNVAGKLLLLLCPARGNKIRSSNTEISAPCTFRGIKLPAILLTAALYDAIFITYTTECVLFTVVYYFLRATRPAIGSAISPALFEDLRAREKGEECRGAVVKFARVPRSHLARAIPGENPGSFSFLQIPRGSATHERGKTEREIFLRSSFVISRQRADV